MREQHHHIGLRPAAERLDGGATGVAGGRHHDGRALTAQFQRVIHQPRQQLHCQVLEGKGRAVKQFQNKGVGADLHQRHHGGMAKRTVSFAGHAGEIARRDLTAGKFRQDIAGHFRIGLAGVTRDGRGVDRRPALRHKKPAVRRKPRKRHVDEALRRSVASGRDVTHAPFLKIRSLLPAPHRDGAF